MSKHKKNQRALLISLAAFLFFSFPMLSIANKLVLWYKIPALCLYLFLGWILIIFLIWLNNRSSPKPNNSNE